MSYRALICLLLSALLTGVAVASLLVGAATLDDPATRAAVLSLRLVRTGAAMLAGAALAIAGALMQGLFRNPLAGPSVLGTTAGASLGGQLALLAGGALLPHLPAWFAPEMAMPIGCLAGALASLLALVAIAGRGAGLVTVLLAGFILGSLCTSVGALATSLAQESWQLGRAMIAFTLGGVEGAGVRHLALAAPLVAAGAVAAWAWGRPLDLMLAGEEEARALGVDTRALTRWTLGWIAALVAAATAIGGGVAFIGLVVPHALRPFAGVEHRRLIPACALGGAALVVACDLVARGAPLALAQVIGHAFGEVPLGVVTGLIGAPVFLLVLARVRKAGEL